MSEEPTLSERFQALSERSTMVRGNRGYGRKPPKKALAQLAQYGPVDVHHYDDTTGLTTVESIHDVNPIIEQNIRDYTSGHDGYSPSRELKMVARIPNGDVVKLMQRGISLYDNNDWPKVAAMLDDPSYLHWRTAPGKISRKRFRHYVAPRFKR